MKAVFVFSNLWRRKGPASLCSRPTGVRLEKFAVRSKSIVVVGPWTDDGKFPHFQRSFRMHADNPFHAFLGPPFRFYRARYPSLAFRTVPKSSTFWFK
jgi:hypothetical protein